MLVFGELALDLGANSQRGRVGGEALRKILLELLQLAKEPVVFRVRHRRTIQDVVLAGRAGEDYPQLAGAAKLRPLGSRRML